MKPCFECNQECCDNVIVEIDKPETLEDWEEVKWQVAHKNVRIILDNCNDWCIEFLTKCKYKGEDGRCTIYKDRPKKCSKHDPEACIVNGDGEYYKVILDDLHNVERYLKEHPKAIKNGKSDKN